MNELVEGSSSFFKQEIQGESERTIGFIQRAVDYYIIQTFIVHEDAVKIIKASAAQAINQGVNVAPCMENVLSNIQVSVSSNVATARECKNTFSEKIEVYVEEKFGQLVAFDQIVTNLREKLSTCNGEFECVNDVIEMALVQISTVPDQFNTESLSVIRDLNALAKQGSDCVVTIIKDVLDEIIENGRGAVTCIYNTLNGQ